MQRARHRSGGGVDGRERTWRAGGPPTRAFTILIEGRRGSVTEPSHLSAPGLCPFHPLRPEQGRCQPALSHSLSRLPPGSPAGLSWCWPVTSMSLPTGLPSPPSPLLQILAALHAQYPPPVVRESALIPRTLTCPPSSVSGPSRMAAAASPENLLVFTSWFRPQLLKQNPWRRGAHKLGFHKSFRGS